MTCVELISFIHGNHCGFSTTKGLVGEKLLDEKVAEYLGLVNLETSRIPDTPAFCLSDKGSGWPWPELSPMNPRSLFLSLYLVTIWGLCLG